MFTKTLPLIGALVIAAAATAQSSAPQATPATPSTPAAKVLGTATQVQGLVTVSIGNTVGSLGENAPILEGSRIVTGSAASLNLNFTEGGCVVKMAPNQSITLAGDDPCDDRKGALAWLSGGGSISTAGAAVPAGFGSSYVPLAGLGFVASAALIDSTIGGTPATVPGGGGGGIPNPPLSGQ